MKISKIFRERDPTRGNIVGNSLGMVFPYWINTGVWAVVFFLNLYWLSKIGIEAIAAVAIGTLAFMLLMMVVRGAATSASVIVGTLTGKEDKLGLTQITKEILVISWILAFILAIIGFFTAPGLLNLLQVEPSVFFSSVSYLRICALGGIITFPFWILNEMTSAARGIFPARIIMFSVLLLQMIFDPLLIVGYFGFPQLGPIGAALVRVFSAATGTILNLWVVFFPEKSLIGKSLIKLDLKRHEEFKVRLTTLKEMVKIGVPHIVEGVIRVGTRMTILGIVASFGTPAIFAYEVGERFLRWVSMAGTDLAKITRFSISQNLGAGKLNRAEKTGWINCGINGLIIGLVGVFLFFFAKEVVGYFTSNPEALIIGIHYIKITTFCGLGYIFFGAGIILREVFAGAKDTRTPMFVNLLTLTGIQLGLAWSLPKFFGLGIYGVWLAILIGMIFYGLVLGILFKLGYWRSKRNLYNPEEQPEFNKPY